MAAPRAAAAVRELGSTVLQQACGAGTWLPLFIRGAVTPKGFRGVTERIL